MPTLPSGLKLALLIDHIMEPDLNWFRAPEGHFWYEVPDLAVNAPPFAPDQESLQQYVTAPVPRTVDEVKAFVRVCIGLPNGMMYWRGETLADFPRYGHLSAEDLAAWQQWASSEPVTRFLESAIAKCATQAEINREARGYAKVQVSDRNCAGARDDEYISGVKVIDNPIKDSH